MTTESSARLKVFALPLVCIAQLMATLDVTIVNLAIPAIQQDFGLSNAGLAWVVDAYTLAFAGLLLVGGRTGDLIGYRNTLIIGIGLFTASSLLGGLAQDSAMLFAARAGQGIGAAVASPTTLALISTLFPQGPARTRAMVAYGAMAGLGITLGLALGGVLTELYSWHWVFLINVPIGLVVLCVAPRVLPDARGVRRRIDVAGAAAATAGMTLLTYGVIRAGTDGWGDVISTATLVAAAVMMMLFGFVERATPEPMLPARILRHRIRLGAYLIAALLFACLYPAFFFLSRTLQVILRQGPIEAGLRFLPLGAGVLLFAIVARRLLAVTQPKTIVTGGTVVTAAAAIGLVFLRENTPYPHLFLPAIIGLGAGVGTTFVANAAMAMTDVGEQDAGTAAGLLSTFQSTGGTIGVAVLASVAATRTRDALTTGRTTPTAALMDGFSFGLTLAAALALLAVVAALFLGRPPRLESDLRDRLINER